MGTPNDQAVLQAIFNPDSPFGDVIELDLEESQEGDEGEPLTLVWVRCWQGWICREEARVSVIQTSKPTTKIFHDPSFSVLA